MGFNDLYSSNTELVLSLGLSLQPSNKQFCDDNRKPSLTLRLSGDAAPDGGDHREENVSGSKKRVVNDQISGDLSAASSLSNASVKREREVVAGGDDLEIEKVSPMVGDGDEDDDDGSNGRKKLRLTKAQSALLEESFKHHSTLNPKQKQELARELKLRPRQVEVWFQNRRARTKLKQTEVDCEFLKKCCETLTEENRRLQKEVNELKALKLSQPLNMKLPSAATLTVCPSCERVGAGAGEAAKGTFSSLALETQLYNPFTSPSSAF